MADALTDFKWPVAADYAVVEELLANNAPGVMIVPRGELNVKSHAPFARPLFRDFAAVDDTSNESMLSFVRTYGLLGAPVSSEVSNPFDVGPAVVQAEVISGDWPGYQFPSAIRHMRFTIELWDSIRLRATANLEEIRKHYFQGFSWARVLYDYKSPLPRTSDITKNAQELLRLSLNHILIECAVGPQVTWTQRGDRFQISHSPRSLIAAMWLQLALAVANDRTIRTCDYCKRVFEISKDPTGSRTRSDSEFCSDKCKSADYRKRKSEAKKMRLAGSTLREIAATVDTEADTVRGWIADISLPSGKQTGATRRRRNS